MKTDHLSVALANHSYPIHFDAAVEALQQTLEKLRSAGRPVRLLTDGQVMEAQPEWLDSAGFKPEEILCLPPGESSKSIDQFTRALRFLAEQACNRDCAVFAFGGGVVGDLAGYVAASYLRGVDFYQIPTTLLAMVDSSVGGKTGINLPEGKNLVGAFWQPKSVFIETDLLRTLPAREFAAGMAEVIKYALLGDRELLHELEELGGLDPASPELPAIVRRCCALKSAIVADDEKETAGSGGRALLNLGHTFAHAIENVAGYGEYLHGEAVAIGLVLATRLSVEWEHLPAESVNRVERLLQTYRLPVRLHSQLPQDELLAAMQRDKKNRGGQLRFITMTALGQATTRTGIPPEQIDSVWQTVQR